MAKTIIKVITPLLLALAMITGKAAATTVSYDLQLNNLFAFTGQTLARVTLTDTTGGVDFKVETLIAGSRLSQFGFNFLGNNQPSGFSISSLPAGWMYDVDIDKQGGFNGFGKFDVEVKDGGSAGWLSPLEFSVTGGSVIDYVALSDKGNSSLFSAHVTDLNDTGSGSCSVADVKNEICTAITGYAGGGIEYVPPAVIPVPPAVWLFGSGLIGLAGIARRRKV